MKISSGLVGLVWRLSLPPVLILFRNVVRLLLLRLFGLVNLLVVQFDCLYLVVGILLFADLLVIICKSQIRALWSLNIHIFSIIGVLSLLDCDHWCWSLILQVLSKVDVHRTQFTKWSPEVGSLVCCLGLLPVRGGGVQNSALLLEGAASCSTCTQTEKI
jgi:hypothetical protein